MKQLKKITMSDEFRDIQENLFEYFEKVDNQMVIDFIDVFVYCSGTTDSKVSEFSEKFLVDNGLQHAYMNYVYDLTSDAYFNRCSLSERSMIQQIHSSLLSIAYNRFRQLPSKPKPKSTPLGRLSKQEKKDLTMVIKGCERHNDDLISDEESTREMFDVEEAKELIDERKRLRNLYTKVLKLIKL